MNSMQSKRERFFLYGVIPIIAALLGSLMTVWATNYMGHSAPSDAVLEIIKNQNMSALEKIKMLDLVNHDSDKFYDFLGRILGVVSFLASSLAVAIGYRLMNRS